MRIRTLLKYYFSTAKNPIAIFFLCYTGISLLGSIFVDNIVVVGFSKKIDGTYNNFTISAIAFTMFISISFLIVSQKDTMFLISRSVSRKEIFLSNMLFLILLAAIISILQVIHIYMNGLVLWLGGYGWLGLTQDLQITQSPDMNNIFIFFVVSFSIYLAFGSVSYSLGSLIARWKYQTIITLAMLLALFIYLLIGTNLLSIIGNIITFMFFDSKSGLFIASKQIAFAVAVLVVSFPVVRGISAARP